MTQIIFTDHRRTARDEFQTKYPFWSPNSDGFVTETNAKIFIVTSFDQIKGLHIDKLYRGPLTSMDGFNQWDMVYTQALVCGAEVIE